MSLILDASKYARFVILGRLMYWTPRSDHWTPPLLKSDNLFLGSQEISDRPPPFKNPGHAPANSNSALIPISNINVI